MASFALATYSERDRAEALADLYRQYGLRMAVVPQDDLRWVDRIIWECRVSVGDADAIERARLCLVGRTPWVPLAAPERPTSRGRPRPVHPCRSGPLRAYLEVVCLSSPGTSRLE
jgi:hypothetical protein